VIIVLDGSSFHVPVDTFHPMRARREIPAEDLPGVLHRT
jgi:chloramphenicol 3-O phosphotransferase